MNEIKFTSKNQYYRAKDESLYENAFVIPIGNQTSLKNKTTTIFFEVRFIDSNSKEKVISTSSKTFDRFNTETIVNVGTDTDPELKEVTQAITDGWAYDKSKIDTWGKPDYLRALGYFSIVDGIYQFPSNPMLFELAKDFIEQAVTVENLPLNENFEYQINS